MNKLICDLCGVDISNTVYNKFKVMTTIYRTDLIELGSKINPVNEELDLCIDCLSPIDLFFRHLKDKLKERK